MVAFILSAWSLFRFNASIHQVDSTTDQTYTRHDAQCSEHAIILPFQFPDRYTCALREWLGCFNPHKLDQKVAYETLPGMDQSSQLLFLSLIDCLKT